MADALIGYTGFVGGNLAAQHHFQSWFNSKNIETIRGQRFDRLIISGMPAAKWIANRDPVGDRTVLDRLWNCVSQCRAETVAIISTIDVYPAPCGVDEDTYIEQTYQQTYGKHRLMLEQRAVEHFPRALSLRLPALYGPGLKKNAIYDLLHNNETHKIPSEASFQFYDVRRLWNDLKNAMEAGLSLVNFVTEPVAMHEVARHAFGIDFTNHPSGTVARYDVRTKHAAIFGGKEGYLESRERVLSGLKAFVTAERRTFL
ncbi:MAG TPA: hypothetical protein VGL71_03545, partial [Urbifossiella sp.]